MLVNFFSFYIGLIFLFDFYSEYIKFIDCFQNVYEKSDSCHDKIDAALVLIRSVMGNVINNSCGEFNEDTDQCSKLGEIPAKRSRDFEFSEKTFVRPIFDVMNSIN